MTNKAPEKKCFWIYPKQDTDEIPYGKGYVEHITQENPHLLGPSNFSYQPNYEEHLKYRHRYVPVISADWVDWKIAEMQKEIDELKEALSFYANKSNWMRSWITNGEEIAASQWADKLKIQDCALLNCGGGRARLALSKHKPEDQNDNT